jgi:DNA polymerase-1
MNLSLPMILVDGSSYLFRAFYALPPLTSKDGHPTGAISGFAQMLHKLFQDYPASPIVVFFDAAGTTHRGHWYSEYKKNRSVPPADLIMQIDPIKNIVRAMGIPLICYSGTEADDLIACVARQYQQYGTVIVCSPDKDFSQLVTETIILENPIDRSRLTPQAVSEKYGVIVEQIPEYFALIGDSSDNIPGVPKIGPKTAQALIKKYGTLEELYKNIADLKGVVAKNLLCYQDNAFLSRRLFLFQTLENLFWPEELPYSQWPEPVKINILEAAQIYEKYDLRRLLTRLPAPKEEKSPYIHTILNWEYVEPRDLEVFVSPQTDGLWELGFCNAEGQWAIDQLSKEQCLEFFHLHPRLTAVSWDWKLQLKHGGFIPKVYRDLWLIAHLGEPDRKWEWKVERQSQGSASCDTMAMCWLYKERIDLLTPMQRTLLDRLEMPLIRVLFHMEQNGVLINHMALQSLDTEWKTELESLKEQSYIIAGKEFNLNSAKQLRHLLFQVRGLQSKVKTPKGELSTNEEALQELADQDPLVLKILRYRHYEKLRSTYTSAWLDRLNESEDRLHTTYDQAGTVTGRLASFDPNLQNIPVRSVEGRRLRQTIIAPPGKKLVSFDYSQIELRLMAHFSQDPVLMEAYDKGLDLHAKTASILNKIPLENVTPEQRSIAKTVNFGLIYGMSAFGLAKQLGLSNAEGSRLIEQYFLTYKGVFEYMSAMRQVSKVQGFVETLLGRKIPIRPSVQKGGGDNSWRAAINGPLQGTASELIKKAMLDLQPLIVNHDGVNMVMQVHDELVFEVPNEYLPSWAEQAKVIMENALALRVPLIVNYSVGSFWE